MSNNKFKVDHNRNLFISFAIKISVTIIPENNTEIRLVGAATAFMNNLIVGVLMLLSTVHNYYLL